jgi:hypothetical protein
MKKVIRIDEQGLFLEDVILQDNELTPEDCIETDCQGGFYLPKWNGTEWVEGGVIPQPDIESIKHSKIAELSNACQLIIFGGIDVETTMGIEHFSLQITDQIEITSQYNKIVMGATEALYHADGNGGNCRLFNATEMTAIATKATEHVTYHKTYFNELKAWVNRCVTVEEIQEITYGLPLPIDLDEHMVGLIGISSIV